MFLNLDTALNFLTQVCDHYEKSAPTVANYADDVYRRLNESEPVQVRELLFLQSLKAESGWEQPNFAANRVYKLESSLGRSTTGHAGF